MGDFPRVFYSSEPPKDPHKGDVWVPDLTDERGKAAMSDQRRTDDDDEVYETQPDGATDDRPGGYHETKAIIEAIDSGMSEEQIAAALEGRAHESGKALLVCRNCGQRGYYGAYPFSTLPPELSRCDDCA